jgi:hypothetical protein
MTGSGATVVVVSAADVLGPEVPAAVAGVVAAAVVGAAVVWPTVVVAGAEPPEPPHAVKASAAIISVVVVLVCLTVLSAGRLRSSGERRIRKRAIQAARSPVFTRARRR